jgi:hypothetical protein
VQGKARGYVTIAALDAVFEALSQNPPIKLEAAHDVLREMGVDVVAGSEGTAP